MTGLRATAWRLAAALCVACLASVTLVSYVPEHRAEELVTVSVHSPTRKASSQAFRKLTPVQTRLQSLTGCSCVDISKTPLGSASVWGNYRPVCCDKSAPMSADAFMDRAIKQATSKAQMLAKAIDTAKEKLDKKISVIVDAQTLKNGGRAGARGPVGKKGPQGYVGAPGEQGLRGPPGVVGPRGVKGFPGQVGYRGATGDIGRKGHQGWEGTPGAPGYVGKDGRRGAAGPEGPPGKQGPAGFRGNQGSVGRQGDPGKMGKGGPVGSVVKMFGWQASTSCQDGRGRNMEYLDRQHLDCTNTMGKAFIGQFQMTSKGCSWPYLQYRLTCLTPAKWKHCANEGGTCTCPGGVVRYGDKSRYARAKDVHVNIRCSNHNFGDPAPGIAKRCECSKGGDIGATGCRKRYTTCQLARSSQRPIRNGGLDWNSCTPGRPCGACEGDCDSDRDCAGNLKCFQRNGNGPGPPGCAASGMRAHMDYCYDPGQPSGRLEYMDRQSVACPAGELLGQMRLTKYQCSSQKMRYEYTCCKPTRGMGQCRDLTTKCNRYTRTRA